MFRGFSLRSLTSEQARYRKSGKLGDGMGCRRWDADGISPVLHKLKPSRVLMQSRAQDRKEARAFRPFPTNPFFSFPFPGLVKRRNSPSVSFIPKTGMYRAASQINGGANFPLRYLVVGIDRWGPIAAGEGMASLNSSTLFDYLVGARGRQARKSRAQKAAPSSSFSTPRVTSPPTATHPVLKVPLLRRRLDRAFPLSCSVALCFLLRLTAGRNAFLTIRHRQSLSATIFLCKQRHGLQIRQGFYFGPCLNLGCGLASRLG